MAPLEYILAKRELLATYIERFPHDRLSRAACRGLHPDLYHPKIGPPRSVDLERCASCAIRLECVALALMSEESDAREGWYGGLAPEDRDILASHLALPVPVRESETERDKSCQAIELREYGWKINEIAAELGCSRRTVQRHLRGAA